MQEFIDYGRDCFSQEACDAIVDYYEGSETELDIVGLYVDWNEEEYTYIIKNVVDLPNNASIEEVVAELNLYTYAVQTSEDTILYLSF